MEVCSSSSSSSSSSSKTTTWIAASQPSVRGTAVALSKASHACNHLISRPPHRIFSHTHMPPRGHTSPSACLTTTTLHTARPTAPLPPLPPPMLLINYHAHILSLIHLPPHHPPTSLLYPPTHNHNPRHQMPPHILIHTPTNRPLPLSPSYPLSPPPLSRQNAASPPPNQHASLRTKRKSCGARLAARAAVLPRQKPRRQKQRSRG